MADSHQAVLLFGLIDDAPHGARLRARRGVAIDASTEQRAITNEPTANKLPASDKVAIERRHGVVAKRIRRHTGTAAHGECRKANKGRQQCAHTKYLKFLADACFDLGQPPVTAARLYVVRFSQLFEPPRVISIPFIDSQSRSSRASWAPLSRRRASFFSPV